MSKYIDADILRAEIEKKITEREKELKSFSDEDYVCSVASDVACRKRGYLDIIELLDSLQQKQNNTESWNEDYNEEDLQIRFAFYTYKDEPSVLYLSNLFVEEASRNRGLGTKILKAADKVAETMGASSICLKVKHDSSANAWYRKNGYCYVAFEDGYDWLEKNLEYLKPKPEGRTMSKNVCDGCWLRDRFGKCQWQPGDKCKATDK